jgi:hypothetical protein
MPILLDAALPGEHYQVIKLIKEQMIEPNLSVHPRRLSPQQWACLLDRVRDCGKYPGVFGQRCR